MRLLNGFLLFISNLLVITCLFASTAKDSLLTIPQIEPTNIASLYERLPNGKYPSDYQFQIANPTDDQLQAWLDGDYDYLQQSFFVNALVSGSKGEMFQKPLEIIREAREVISEVQRIGNFISRLDGESLFKLPVGISKTKDDGTRYSVAIHEITLFPTKAELRVYAEVFTPDMEKPLYFGSPDVGFSRAGGVSLGSLGLIGDFEIPILDGKCDLNFKGAKVVDDAFVIGQGTYVEFSCDGLEGFNLDIDLTFDREVIIPADPEDDAEIRAELEVGATNGLNDILVEINIDKPFVHPDYKDVIWTVQNVIFDFSETQHADGLTFPVAEYTPVVPDINLWKGVSIGEISVELPDDLLGDNSNSFGSDYLAVKEVIIDHNGFTGLVEVAPVLALESGDMNGWAFSIDWFSTHIYRNKLAGVTFDGLINIPLFNDSEDGKPTSSASVAYLASIDVKDDIYRFDIRNTEEQVFYAKMLHAEVTLDPTSTLSVQYSAASGFEVTATLNGDIEIDAQISENVELQVPTIGFEGVTIGNTAPFIKSGGTWDLGADSLEVRLKAFTLTVSDIAMVPEGDNGDQASLRFLANINLAEGSQIDLSATGGFRLLGQIDETPEGHQNWRFEKLKVDLLQVAANTPAFEFDGYVVFFEDAPQFGSGFQGKMDLTLKKLGNTGIAAMAIFGTTTEEANPDNEYRYFLVDVMAKFPANVLSVGPMSIRGIGGGVYYHMRQQSVVEDFSVAGTGPLPEYEEGEEDAYTEAILNEYLGRSLSNILYLPDNSVKLGVNAGVVLATSGNEEAFNANLVFNIEINDDGGVNHIRLVGYANFMAPISWTGPACTGVSTRFALEYVFENENNPDGGYFHAAADIFINTGALRGATTISLTDDDPDPLFDYLQIGDCSALYYAGGVDMLFAEDHWHINIGVPGVRNEDDPYDPSLYPPGAPIGVKLTLFGLGGTLSGYLDIGNAIPPFPGLPANVADVTGLNNIVANESERATGSGFAFGLQFTANNSINAFDIFEAGLFLDLGFDLMLQKYQDAYCVNTGSNLGINGWYASGQAWAYVEGYVKALGITIFDVALGAAIQLKGPNPTYGRASVGGRYRILGGLIKGTCRFPIKIGTECELEGGGTIALDYEIISGVAPFNGGSNESIATKPNVLFNYPIDEVVNLGTGTVGNEEFFVIKLDHFRLLKDGSLVPGTFVEEAGMTYTEYLTENFLDPETEYQIEVKATLYETNEAGSVLGAEIDSQEEIITFTTGKALNYIPETNVQYAYPANGQFNYYQQQSPNQYVQLERGQDALLEDISASGALKMRLENASFESIIDVNYQTNNNRLVFDLPNLTNGGAYQASIFNENADGSTEDDIIYRFYFRVSNYATFNAKMQAASMSSLNQEDVPGFGSGTYVSTFNGLNEPFGIEEVIGLNQYAQAIDLSALLSNTPWMDNFTNKYIPDLGLTVDLYDTSGDCTYHLDNMNYPSAGFPRSELGDNMPDKAVFLGQEGSYLCVVTAENYEDLNAAAGSPNPVPGVGPAKLIYLVPRIVQNDINRLRYGSNLITNAGYATVTNHIEESSAFFCSSYCTVDGDPIDPIFLFEAGVNYECDFATCCIENDLYRDTRYQVYLNFYNSPENFCLRLTHTMIDNSSCSYPFQARSDLYTAPTSGSNYPVNIDYIYPDQQAAGSTVTKNISY